MDHTLSTKKSNTQHKLSLKFRTVLKRRTLKIQNCIYKFTCLVPVDFLYFLSYMYVNNIGLYIVRTVCMTHATKNVKNCVKPSGVCILKNFAPYMCSVLRGNRILFTCAVGGLKKV